MTEDNEFDPLARLRAADPATGVEPSADFADSLVARVTRNAPAASDDDSAVTVTELTSERLRRRPIWRPLAAAAAAIVIIGGAGFAIGVTTSGSGLGGAAAPISLGGISTPLEGRVSPHTAAGPADSARYGFGRNSFTASGLSTAAGEATGYGYDPRSASTTATVSALSTALGFDEAPDQKDSSWLAGTQDGTAAALTVEKDGLLSFYYSDPQKYPQSCMTDPETSDDSGDSSSSDDAGSSKEPTESCEPSDPVLPAHDEAITALRSLLSSTGHDPGSFEFTSEAYDGAFARTAQAWPVVDGQRLDQMWSLDLTATGIVSASGFLAPLVSTGEYPIVSAQEAFERLSDPRFGATQAAMPFARAADEGSEIADGDTSASDSPDSHTQPPAAPSAGAPLSWPVHQVRIISARLGLTTLWQPDGTVLVAPAYEFADPEGGTWSVIAVAESKLRFDDE